MCYKSLSILCSVILLFLTGCSTINHHYREFAPDRDATYLEAQASDPLTLPEGIEMAENNHSPYVIPAGPLPGPDAEPMKLIPPGGQSLWDQAKLQIAKAENSEEDEE